MTVIPKPLYNPLTPSDLRTSLNASKDEALRPYEPVCVRDLTTSTGTRTKHATTSPTDAATTWFHGVPPAGKAFFSESYVVKKAAAAS